MDQKCVRCGRKTEKRLAARLRDTGRWKRNAAYYFSAAYISRNERERVYRWCSALAARRQTAAGNHFARDLIYDGCTSLNCQGAAASPRTLPEDLRTSWPPCFQ